MKLLLFSLKKRCKHPPSRQTRHGGTTKKALTQQEPCSKSECLQCRTFIYFLYYAKTVFDLYPKGLILRRFCDSCPLSCEVKKDHKTWTENCVTQSRFYHSVRRTSVTGWTSLRRRRRPPPQNPFGSPSKTTSTTTTQPPSSSNAPWCQNPFTKMSPFSRYLWHPMT